MLWQPRPPSELLFTPPAPWGFAQVNGLWVPESLNHPGWSHVDALAGAIAAQREFERANQILYILWDLPPDLRRWELAKSLAEAEAAFNEQLDAIATRHRMHRT